MLCPYNFCDIATRVSVLDYNRFEPTAARLPDTAVYHQHTSHTLLHAAVQWYQVFFLYTWRIWQDQELNQLAIIDTRCLREYKYEVKLSSTPTEK